jgi:hypothetical protein
VNRARARDGMTRNPRARAVRTSVFDDNRYTFSLARGSTDGCRGIGGNSSAR